MEAKDSSDSVIDGEDLFLFCVGWKDSVALVAAFLFGRVGGSAITIDVSGSSIGGAKSVTFSFGGSGGAGTKVFFWFNWHSYSQRTCHV